MQQVTRKKLGAGVNLTCVTTPKFKRAVMRVMLLLPLGGPDAALRACRETQVPYGFVEQETWDGDPFRCLGQAFAWLRAQTAE